MRLLDRFNVVLLDMNNTFMFGGDRFDNDQNFHHTYLSVGGTRLSAADVTRFIKACYDGMLRDYNDPACYDNFPSLRDGFRRFANPPEEELPFLELLFTVHELGYVPDDYAALLHRLAKTHRLGVVTNIWSPKHAWLSEFKRAGIDSVFQDSIFSSDSTSIKPSAVLYQAALRNLGVPPSEALFVGDSLLRDMQGAKSAGMTTVWLTSQPHAHLSVDYSVPLLQNLETIMGDQ